MGMPELIVTAVLTEGRSKSEVARQYKVGRRWVIILVQRFLAEGDAGLQPRSRRPHRGPHQVSPEIEDQIVAIRKELDRDGHEAGAATIAYHLEQRHGHTPAVSTIWRILSARGFVTPQPHKRPKSSYCRFQADQPNEMWGTDTTHWTLADGTDVEILNILDDHSRLCLASTTRRTFKAGDVDQDYQQTACQYGDPAALLSDNGAIFTGLSRGGGRVALEITLAARGVRFTHSRPYHPQTNGKVERFHQTLKKWLRTQPRARTPAQLSAQLDTFREYYNNVRPHRALGRRTPAQAYAARPKAQPRLPKIDTSHWRTRQDTVDKSGIVTLRHNSRLHHIGVGRSQAGTKVLLLVKDLDVRIINRDTAELLHELALDPPRTTNRSRNVNDVPGHLCTVSRDITFCSGGRI